MHQPNNKIEVKHYKIDFDAEGFFECFLSDTVRIDIPFYSLHQQIAIVEPKLSRVLNKYQTWEEEIDFLTWAEIDLIPYMNSYIERLYKDNNNSLQDLVWTLNPINRQWELDDYGWADGELG